MKKVSFILTALPAITISLYLLTGCTKEKENERPPSYHITQSEKLSIPASVALPESETGYSRVATYYAIGVQKYKSQVKAGSFPESYEWVFVAPRADLYDITNRFVGTHGAGPHWALTGGADSIFAQHLIPPHTAPSPEPGTIDWLLLKTKTGTIPTGLFAEVDFIQRIATSGGKAPAELPVSAGQTIEVPYTAIYRFSKEKP